MFGREKYLFLYLLSHFVFAMFLLNSIIKFMQILPELHEGHGALLIGLLTDFSIIYIFDNIKNALNEEIDLYSFDIIIELLILTKGLSIIFDFYKLMYTLEYSDTYSIFLALSLSLIYMIFSLKLAKLISFKGIFQLGRLLFFSSLFSMTLVLSNLGGFFKGLAFHYIGHLFLDIYKVDNEEYWS